MNIVDGFSRECTGEIVDLSISGERLARCLDELAVGQILSREIVLDNAREMTCKAMYRAAECISVSFDPENLGQGRQVCYVGVRQDSGSTVFA